LENVASLNSSYQKESNEQNIVLIGDRCF